MYFQGSDPVSYTHLLTDLLSDSLFDLPPEQTAELPNILLMETAAHSLLGTHDFKHFSSIRKKKGTEKEIKTITFVTEESTLYIRMTANDFLYQMAPFILGTLLDCLLYTSPARIPATWVPVPLFLPKKFFFLSLISPLSSTIVDTEPM